MTEKIIDGQIEKVVMKYFFDILENKLLGDMKLKIKLVS